MRTMLGVPYRRRGSLVFRGMSAIATIGGWHTCNRPTAAENAPLLDTVSGG